MSIMADQKLSKDEEEEEEEVDLTNPYFEEEYEEMTPEDLVKSSLPEENKNKRRENKRRENKNKRRECHYTAQVFGGVCKMCPREKKMTGEDEEAGKLAHFKEEAKVEEERNSKLTASIQLWEKEEKESSSFGRKKRKKVQKYRDEESKEAAESSLTKLKRRRIEGAKDARDASKEDVNKIEVVAEVQHEEVDKLLPVDDNGFLPVAILKNTFTFLGKGKDRRQKLGITFDRVEEDEPCGLCEKVFNSKKSLGSHVNRKHDMGMKVYHFKVGQVLQNDKENEEEKGDQIDEEKEKAKVTPKRKKPALNRIENPKEAKKDYTCGICNKFQKDANGRSSHVARNHKMKMEEYHIIVETAAANVEGGFETEKALGGDAADPLICIAHLPQSANYAEDLAKDIIQNVLKLVVDGKEDECTDEEKALLKLPQKDKEEHAKENVTVENVKKEDALADNALIECIDIEEEDDIDEEDDNAKENVVEENEQVEHMEGANDHLLIEEDEREGAENSEIFDKEVEKEIEEGNDKEDDDIQIIDEIKAPEPDGLDEILNFQDDDEEEIEAVDKFAKKEDDPEEDALTEILNLQDGEVDQTTKEDQPAGEGVAEEENAKKVRVEDEANQNTQKENAKENEKPEDKTAEVDDEEENEDVEDKTAKVDDEEENEDVEDKTAEVDDEEENEDVEDKTAEVEKEEENENVDDKKEGENGKETTDDETDETEEETEKETTEDETEEETEKEKTEEETEEETKEGENEKETVADEAIAKGNGEKMSGFLSTIWRL